MWTKKGVIYNVDGLFDWNKSHAQVPVVDILEDRLRIYYATRNSSGKSNISFIEVEKDCPSNILYTHQKVVLDFGKLGSFDDSGLMPTCIVNVDEKKYLYYIGWTTRGTVPYHNSVGLAISENGIDFKKAYEGPIITVNKLEPYFSGTAFVMYHEKKFKMWYLSCVGWQLVNEKAEPFYHIKYAESENGHDWNQTGKVALELLPGEGGLVSASVLAKNNRFQMWYGVRGYSEYRTNKESSYRIGYAESKDGIHWERKDELSGIQRSEEGWDSEMISYPYVIMNKKPQMFYNGNGFGKTGFGFAELN